MSRKIDLDLCDQCVLPGTGRDELVGANARIAQRLGHRVGPSLSEFVVVGVLPGEFRLDRRVTFEYTTRYGPYRDIAAEEAATDLAAAAPAPYTDITRFVPKPLPPNLATSVQGTSLITAAQVELENWRWGKIPPTLRSEINSWVQNYGKLLSTRIDTEPALDATTVEGYSIEPRTLVKAIVDDLLADPATFLEQATGQKMSLGGS